MRCHELFRPQWVLCERNGKPVEPKEYKPSSMFEVIQSGLSSVAFDKPVEILSEPGTYYGYTAGVCTGFALKKVAKAAAFTFGAVFTGFQLAAQSGYVKMDWKKVEEDVKKYLPEKRIEDSDVLNDAVKYLTTNTGIAATVFSGGFLTGLKVG